MSNLAITETITDCHFLSTMFSCYNMCIIDIYKFTGAMVYQLAFTLHARLYRRVQLQYQALYLIRP